MNSSATHATVALPPKYWRSLAEHAQPGEMLGPSPEFLRPAPAWDEAVSRRGFLKFVGASAALSGLTACTREPIQPIVPYVERPEELVPGRPLHYATAMTMDGFATGLVVESHEGHPTKIEGNPNHPSSLGATGIFQQAALLDLYDPDRPRAITYGGQVSNFAQFMFALHEALRQPRARQGAGLRILSHSITSPTLTAQLDALLKQYPEARWHQYQPMARDNTLEGARLAFGRPIETRYNFDRARVILSLDADFLFTHPFNLAHARQFAASRQPGAGMSRLYVIEPSPSITGGVADHRLPASSSEMEAIAFALARENGVSQLADHHGRWMAAVGQDLRQHHGQSLIVAGESQKPAIHALAHQLNEQFGNVGQTVEYADSAETHWVNQGESLAQLVRDIDDGRVECLIILGGNPVFDAPMDLAFRDHLARVTFAAHLSVDFNETSAGCQWHIPESHFLESWGDARSFDGTTSIVQPLIAPLYDSKTAHELLSVIHDGAIRSDYDLVRDHWRTMGLGDDFENSWRKVLHDGLIEGTRFAPVSIRPHGSSSSSAPVRPENPAQPVEIIFRPDPCLWDGRFANNGWLQELPKPFSKVTWDNPALISPALAQRLQVTNNDMITLRNDQRNLSLPVWITPGQAENCITVHLGAGRTRTGHTGADVGFNGFVLRDSAHPWFVEAAVPQKTGQSHPLATTQHSHDVHGRDIIRDTPIADYLASATALQTGHEPPPLPGDTLYNQGEFDNPDYAWGMAIDLNSCIGCNACMLACQSENNIPVVGREQVAAGRDMAWIRVDQYFEGGPGNPRVHHQPVPCMHCENAPCELVCPVGATLHDHEGLNLQVYNRCVGTRYCSNNCPYKVRRFNFFRYADYETASLKPMRNPNVTVRWRGVMEKCTYCLQRISAARIASQLENRRIPDGAIQTACQQVCPARAITFGDIKDRASAVARLKASPRNYAMLGELNTRPRTTYLGRIRNPNPQLEEPA